MEKRTGYLDERAKLFIPYAEKKEQVLKLTKELTPKFEKEIKNKGRKI